MDLMSRRPTRESPELARDLTARQQSDAAGPDGDMVLCRTKHDPRSIGTVRQLRVGKIEQDLRATDVQGSTSVLEEAQLPTANDAIAVFPQFGYTRGTWPGIHRPGDVLSHGPLDPVLCPTASRGPCHRATTVPTAECTRTDMDPAGAGCTASTLTNTPPSSSTDVPNTFAETGAP